MPEDKAVEVIETTKVLVPEKENEQGVDIDPSIEHPLPKEMMASEFPLPEPPVDRLGRVSKWKPRELMFRDVYLSTGSPSKAYVAAGFKSKNQLNLSSNAHHYVNKPRIRLLIAAAMKVINSRVTPENVLKMMQERLQELPEQDDWTWHHWIRVLKMAGQASGVLGMSNKEGQAGRISIGTMQVLQMSQQAPLPPAQPPTAGKQ